MIIKYVGERQATLYEESDVVTVQGEFTEQEHDVFLMNRCSIFQGDVLWRVAGTKVGNTIMVVVGKNERLPELGDAQVVRMEHRSLAQIAKEQAMKQVTLGMKVDITKCQDPDDAAVAIGAIAKRCGADVTIFAIDANDPDRKPMEEPPIGAKIALEDIEKRADTFDNVVAKVMGARAAWADQRLVELAAERAYNSAHDDDPPDQWIEFHDIGDIERTAWLGLVADVVDVDAQRVREERLRDCYVARFDGFDDKSKSRNAEFFQEIAVSIERTFFKTVRRFRRAYTPATVVRRLNPPPRRLSTLSIASQLLARMLDDQGELRLGDGINQDRVNRACQNALLIAKSLRRIHEEQENEESAPGGFPINAMPGRIGEIGPMIDDAMIERLAEIAYSTFVASKTALPFKERGYDLRSLWCCVVAVALLGNEKDATLRAGAVYFSGIATRGDGEPASRNFDLWRTIVAEVRKAAMVTS